MTKQERRVVQHLQTLFGRIEALAHDDRNPNRMEQLIPATREGFASCLGILAKYPPGEP